MNQRIDTEGMMIFDGSVPIAEKVVLRRVPVDTDYPGIGRVTQELVETNVPWLVIAHSPGGFEWGYGGSGPSDFALNILENVLPSLGYPAEWIWQRTKCHKNDCATLAWQLHQPFKWYFLAPMPKEGGTITLDEIKTWLAEPAQQAIIEKTQTMNDQARQWAIEDIVEGLETDTADD